MVNTNVRQWIAVQVRPRSEPVVSLLLKHKGYETFLPVCNRNARRLAPVFPGYVFCVMNEANTNGLIVTTSGVVRLVGTGGCPEVIPSFEMDAVIKAVESGLLVQPCNHFIPGEDVEVVDGPLRGCRGKIKSLHDREHMIVNLTLLQRSLIVTMCASWLRPIPNRMEPGRTSADNLSCWGIQK